MIFCCFGQKNLNTINYNDTVTFIPNIDKCKVIKVYDGDTITVATFLNNDKQCYRFSVRLNGIDSPEIKSKNENEKKAAQLSRDKLSEQILNKIIVLKNISIEKYGRLLADVLYNNTNMNKWMLDNKYAISYDGGKKTPFENL
tara:strand:- start:1440 stop:1868 length:429 start_codon:yes stop_codon:yes gene_type:complete